MPRNSSKKDSPETCFYGTGVTNYSIDSIDIMHEIVNKQNSTTHAKDFSSSNEGNIAYLMELEKGPLLWDLPNDWFEKCCFPFVWMCKWMTKTAVIIYKKCSKVPLR